MNKEPHHFQTESTGSLVNARRARLRGDDVVAMVSQETVGYCDLRAGSQRYPPLLSPFYPDRGDFIAFVGSTEMAPRVRHALATFRERARFPSERRRRRRDTPYKLDFDRMTRVVGGLMPVVRDLATVERRSLTE